MQRLGKIQSVTFDAAELPGPLSLRIGRSCQNSPAFGQAGGFAASVQVFDALTAVEVRLRDVSACDGLSLGQAGELEIVIAPTGAGQKPRQISIASAVLVGQELQYDQKDLAEAKLTFLAESADGASDPFAATEVTA